MTEKQLVDLRAAISYLTQAQGILDQLQHDLPEAPGSLIDLPGERDTIRDAGIALDDIIKDLETM